LKLYFIIYYSIFTICQAF